MNWGETMHDTKTIEILLDEQELSIQKRRELWALHRDRLLPIVQDLKKLGASLDFQSSIDISLSGDSHRLAAAIRAFRTRTFTTASERPKKGDSSWGAWFSREDCTLQFWFHFSSTVCRRVKVGTRVIEQDIYETVCDELVLPAGPAT